MFYILKLLPWCLIWFEHSVFDDEWNHKKDTNSIPWAKYLNPRTQGYLDTTVLWWPNMFVVRIRLYCQENVGEIKVCFT